MKNKDIAEKVFQANRQRDYSCAEHWLRGLSREDRREVDAELTRLGKEHREANPPAYFR